MSSDAIENLISELQNYGVSNHWVRIFNDSASSKNVNYLDLIKSKNKELIPDGVVENQGRPLLYFINESRLAFPIEQHKHNLDELRHKLACRGDRAYLARILPGELKIIPVYSSQKTPDWLLYNARDNNSLTLFSRMAGGYYETKQEKAEVDFIFNAMFKLLENANKEIKKELNSSDVLSLTGRALFFRFLLDRKIPTGNSNPLTSFDDAENAFHTCGWLDKTFGGGFLPLTENGSLAFFKQLSKTVFKHLSAIVHGHEPVSAGDYQTKLQFKEWGDFDFAHVPVGLLSQVYEAFCWEVDHEEAKSTSVHYTPRNIAAILVDEVFDGMPDAQNCRVLDPSCGASVFLVLAFRRLYCERWQATGNRPDTKAIREILENQIVGFDISDSALRLAALSLYLTAIELDPEPIPPENLRFENLTDRTLFNHRQAESDPDKEPVIGSLGGHVGNQFDGKFDIVLGNPPWTSIKELEDKNQKKEPKEKTQKEKLTLSFTQLSKQIIAQRGNLELSRNYQNPNSEPDLPFFWKATEWCKPNGRIAMVLPTRILFKQEKLPSAAREILFRLVEVTAIINGSNLTDTKVWPNMAQPFMLVFACNRVPSERQALWFITPYCDTVLNRKGEFRIDAKSARTVEVEASFNDTWLWKALSIGTTLDVDVIRQIKASQGQPLQEYWEKGLGLISGNGYQIRPKNQNPKDASFLIGLRNLTSKNEFQFIVQHENLPFFEGNEGKAASPRKPEIYRAPLLLVREAPGAIRTRRALLSFKNIAYNEDFCGYSASGHLHGEILVRYVHLFVLSNIWMHYALLTASQFAAERRTIAKSILDECPIIPLTSLTSEQHQKIQELSEQLIHSDIGNEQVFKDIDLFFAGLYGLDNSDMEVINDTLEVCLPYKESRERACAIPSEPEKKAFQQKLEEMLRPFFTIVGEEPEINLWTPEESNSLFTMVLVGKRGQAIEKYDKLFYDLILKLANDTGTTRIIYEAEGCLVIGILNQYRYWTMSRARLLGSEIIRQYMTVFED